MVRCAVWIVDVDVSVPSVSADFFGVMCRMGIVDLVSYVGVRRRVSPF
jgi:hypothetical protein